MTIRIRAWAAGLAVLACLHTGSSQTVTVREADREQIARVVSSCIGWAKDKDLKLFYGAIANDEDYISVSPGPRVVKRFEDVKQNVPYWMSPDFKYVRHELRNLKITFAARGDVAWFFCILDDINTFKGEPAEWKNTRWTGVVEKRDDRWVIVLQHFSFAKSEPLGFFSCGSNLPIG
jgi:ketosteroid isomerase-like protein